MKITKNPTGMEWVAFSQGRGNSDDQLRLFRCLVTSVERIARHVYYPGIDEAIEHCLEDLDELTAAGRITPEEREALRIVLLGMTMTASSNTSNAA